MAIGRSCDLVMEDCAHELAVLVRPATLTDAVQLIELNKCFRREMAQWEADFNDDGECLGYPVLDFDDVQYILEEEQPINLMVLCRSLEGKERCIGYSYSYSEPWESTTAGHTAPAQGIMSPRVNRGKGQRNVQKSGTETNSLYIAELFISEVERGLGLGELLLGQTLNVHSHDSERSHLFVSSKNVGAVRCYLKFGYQKGLKPSGDLAHDLVMELPSSKASVADAARRFDKQLTEGTVGARKRRCTGGTSKSATTTKPPALTGAKAGSESSDSRSSSRASVHSSPPSKASVLCPRVLRARNRVDDNKVSNGNSVPATAKASKTTAARTTRASIVACDNPHTPMVLAGQRSSKRSPLMSTNDPARDAPSPKAEASPRSSKTTINGRQRKFRSNAQDAPKAINGKGKGAVARKGGFAVFEDAPQRESSGMERRSKNKLKFMLTLFSDGKRKVAEERIKSLGGEVISADCYDHRCTHLVSARPATTEKFLCATAAGKHVLQPSYIEDSFEAGYFLAESDYKWSNADANLVDSFELGLAQAPIMWRAKAKSKQASTDDGSIPTGCFDGVVAVVLSTSEKQDGYKRILEAGGAEVCEDLRELVCGKSSLKRGGLSPKDLIDLALRDTSITHVFVSEDVRQMVLDGWDADGLDAFRPACETLRGQGVKFLFEEYIVEKIVHNVDLRAKHAKGLVLDVDAWFHDVRKTCRKRKAADDSDAGCPARARAKSSPPSAWLMPVLWR